MNALKLISDQNAVQVLRAYHKLNKDDQEAIVRLIATNEGGRIEQPSTSSEKALSMSKVKEVTRTHPNTIKKWFGMGLKNSRKGNSVLIDESELRNFLRKNDLKEKLELLSSM